MSHPEQGCVGDQNYDGGPQGDVQAALQLRLRALAPDSVLSHAFDRFYDTYSSVVRRFAAAYHLSPEHTADLVQAVWAEVSARLPATWDSNGTRLRAWLLSVVRSKAIDFIRRERLRATESLSQHESIRPLAVAEADPAAIFERQCERELVLQALSELKKDVSDDNYRILEMRYFEGRTIAEIATSFGLSEDAVGARQQRMFDKLRPRLAVYLGRDADQ